jgi:hypothetical protein
MTPAEIAAYIGAAAWLPIIISWVYKLIVTPHVTIIPDELPEIGFTTFGPIVNIRIAITTTRKPAVLDSIDLTLIHQDGESRMFHWSGMNEQVNQIVDAAGNRQTIEKETNPIAFLVGVESVLEKLVRFQDRSFNQEMLPMLDALAEKVHFGLRQQNYSQVAIKASNEFDNVKRGWVRNFTWKTGTYTASFSVSSPTRLKLTQIKIQFQLNDTDIEILRRNLIINENYHVSILKQVEDGTVPSVFQWNWRYPRTIKLKR